MAKQRFRDIKQGKTAPAKTNNSKRETLQRNYATVGSKLFSLTALCF